MKYNNYNKREKITIISILVAIMEADGIIDPHEIDFLNDVITKFEMSESELEQVIETDINLVVSDFKQFSECKRLESKELFIGMAKCDGYADERELKIIDKLF